MKERERYNYYAFISYKRQDEKWARWIHRNLETYRIPSVIRKKNLNVPAKIYPVFLDKTDITGGKLLERLHEELDQSQYLIVICSPNSAKSEWVNREISHFIESGREDYIVPVIVEGKPHAEDESEECYPPALRTEVQSEILGISVEELGKHKAFLRTAATLLNLKYDQLVMRDKRRRRRRRIIQGSAAGIFLIGAAAAAWYYMPHSAYYNGYVYQYEVPVGRNRLSAEERKGLADCYKIVTQRGRVVRLEWVNSAGEPARPTVTTLVDGPVRVDFFYEGDRLSRAEYRDENDQPILVKDYSSNLKAVDFIRAEDASQAVTLGANQSGMAASLYNYADQGQEAKSGISRYVNTYDDEGYLIKSMFMRDNLNTPARDSSGVYGWAYERDGEGHVTKVLFLDEDGEVWNAKNGVAISEYGYDGEGNLIWGRTYDKDGNPVRDENGVAQTEVFYEDGNVVRYRCMDEEGEPWPNLAGVTEICYEYTGEGFLKELRQYDAEGEPVYARSGGVHGVRYGYDTHGRISSILYCDEDGEPVNTLEGYAQLKYRYDGEGRVERILLYDQDGSRTCLKNSGAYGSQYSYDENGYMEKEVFLGEDGQPVRIVDGNAERQIEYDEYGRVIRERYLDEKGKPVRIRSNYAGISYSYDKLGNITELCYEAEDGSPCLSGEGIAAIVRTYDETGNLVLESYRDMEGEPCVVSCGYASIEFSYDANGNCIQEAYRDMEGKLTETGEGIAVIRYVCDEYGNVTEGSYYDAEERPVILLSEKVHKIAREYDSAGNVIRETKTGVRGFLPADTPFEIVSYAYDENRNCIRESRRTRSELAEAEEPDTLEETAYDYDRYNRLVLTRYYDGDGNPRTEDGYAARRKEYDERHQVSREIYYGAGGTEGDILYQEIYGYDTRGNRVLSERRDKEGALLEGNRGFARIESKYDPAGNKIEEAYYDAKGDPCLTAEGYARMEQEFDVMGNGTAVRYYDAEGNLTETTYGYAALEGKYDDQGRIQLLTYYGADGELVGDEEELPSMIEYLYDKEGRQTGLVYYDSEGNRIDEANEDAVLIQIQEVSEEAAQAGLREGDYLFRYGEWELFEYAEFSSMSDGLAAAITAGLTNEKEVVIGRVASDGTLSFDRLLFDAGTLGVRLVEAQCKKSDFEFARASYEAWTANEEAWPVGEEAGEKGQTSFVGIAMGQAMLEEREQELQKRSGEVRRELQNGTGEQESRENTDSAVKLE